VHKIDGLVGVIQAIEFPNYGRSGVVVLAELFLLLVRLIAFLDEVVPLFETGERAHVCILSLGERLGLYVDVDVCVGGVIALENEVEFAEEAGAGLPVEDAVFEAGADGEWAAFAVD
jgi:S-adenosylmethionine/arginine decarboxylase-like enzyme